MLLAEERAITAATPGTTRDIIEEVVNILGLPVRLMDTAGLRESVDEVEKIGIERALKRASEADLILFVVDAATEGNFNEDLKLMSEFEGKRRIVVANKMDLASDKRAGEIKDTFASDTLVLISALKVEGLPDLEEAVTTVTSTGTEKEIAPGELITSAREKAALERTLTALTSLLDTVKLRATLDVVAGELRLAIDALAEITGETTTEDILDKIFKNFCIGK